MTHAPLTVVMTADAVGGVWSYADSLCTALPEFHFVLAILGPPPRPAQRAAIRRLSNVTLVESNFRLEWMAGGQADIAASRRWLDGLAERHAADLVHVNGYAQARLDGGRPVLAVSHSDVLSWWIAVRGADAPVEWQDYRRQVIAGLQSATRVVTPTRAVGDDLCRRYGLRLHHAEVIPNGIHIAGFPPRHKRPVIMAAGRIWDDAKNLRLLDAVAPHSTWPVEIAGETAHPEHGVARLRYARQLGVLTPSEMRRRLGEAAIFAAPARYEPFGLGILEAAAAGCALLLGDIASLRENWDGAAVFLPVDNAEEWQAALAHLIGNCGERVRLAIAARSRAKCFTLGATAARYRALYLKMLGGSAARQVA